MTPRRPYLLRAMYDWILDNGETPHIHVDTSYGGCDVPKEYIRENNTIILNISESAAPHLYIDDDEIGFNARFDGEKYDVKVPVCCVTAIYCHRTGAGLMLGPATQPEVEEIEEQPTKKPHLRLVVNNED